MLRGALNTGRSSSWLHLFSAMQGTIIFALVALVAGSQAFSLVDPHIVGGEEATPHQFPHQAAIYIKYDGKQAFCGGVLIHENWILTAAHCAVPIPPTQSPVSYEIVLGAHNVSDKTERHQQRFISSERYFLPEWIGNPANPMTSASLANDIALIRLPTPAEINKYVKPIALPSEDQVKETFYDKEVILSGWGMQFDGSKTIAPTLRYVKSKVVSNFFCKLSFLFLLVGDNNICASGRGGKGACHGDSGGPMITYSAENEPVLVGITSFGLGFRCSWSWPSAYTRVTYYLDWIKANTQGDLQ